MKLKKVVPTRDHFLYLYINSLRGQDKDLLTVWDRQCLTSQAEMPQHPGLRCQSQHLLRGFGPKVDGFLLGYRVDGGEFCGREVKVVDRPDAIDDLRGLGGTD